MDALSVTCGDSSPKGRAKGGAEPLPYGITPPPIACFRWAGVVYYTTSMGTIPIDGHYPHQQTKENAMDKNEKTVETTVFDYLRWRGDLTFAQEIGRAHV